jgi:hypothetical protein
VTNELYLLASTFGVVFFLGFQSLCVNSGQYWLAALNSLIIGTFNLLLFKMAPQVSGIGETAAYLLGGPIGIVCAMLAHRALARWLTERKAA